MPFIAIALVLAAAIGGGTSIAAQNALPGDALWGFKVGVNENIQAALAAEGKAQAEFDIAAIEARLEEAKKLAAEARLSAKAEADLKANFEAHAASVAQQIAKLHEEGDFSDAADIAARFQAAIATGGSALAETNAGAEVSAEAQAAAKAHVTALLEVVHSTLRTASDISAQASIKAAAQGNTQGSANAQGGSENPNTATSSTGASVNGSVNTDVQVGGGASGSSQGQGGVQIDL